jgi:hypothetical protein
MKHGPRRRNIWRRSESLRIRCSNLWVGLWVEVNLGVMRLTALTVQIAGPARTDRDIRFTIKVTA